MALLNTLKPLHTGPLYFVRWSVLPEMCKKSNLQSALCIGNGDNDEVVLVVGGCGGKGNEAGLLSNRPYKMGVKQNNRVNQWRWHKLSPMQEERPCRPGLLLLGRERVLVCGGGDSSGRNKTAEILQLPMTRVCGPGSPNQ